MHGRGGNNGKGGSTQGLLYPHFPKLLIPPVNKDQKLVTDDAEDSPTSTNNDMAAIRECLWIRRRGGTVDSVIMPISHRRVGPPLAERGTSRLIAARVHAEL
jgi:hypothetical protein